MKTIKSFGQTNPIALKNIVRAILRREDGFNLLLKAHPRYAKRIGNVCLDDLTSRQITILYNRFQKVCLEQK